MINWIRDLLVPAQLLGIKILALVKPKHPAFLLPDLILGLSLMALTWAMVLPLGQWFLDQGERLQLDTGFGLVTDYLSTAQQCAMYLHNGPVKVQKRDTILSWDHLDSSRHELDWAGMGLGRVQLQNGVDGQFTATGNVQNMFRVTVRNPALPGLSRTLYFQPVTGRMVLENEKNAKEQKE